MSWPTSPAGPRKDPYGQRSSDDAFRSSDYLDRSPVQENSRLRRSRNSRPPSSSNAEDTVGRNTFEPHHSLLAVTDVQVRLVDNERLRGWATITLNRSFVVKGIRIIQGKTRIFVAMPSKQQKDGRYQDIAHPITSDFRDYLEHCVLDVFNRLEEQGGYRMPPASADLDEVEDIGDGEGY